MHTYTQKSNLIIKIFRDTLFWDTHVASRSTLLDLQELTLDIKTCCGSPFLSSPANLFRFWGLHFLFIALLLASQKVSVIPPDFIPSCLANVDSPPSSYVSHMKLFRPLLCKKKKNCVPLSYAKIKILLVQQHHHCLAIRVQCLSEPKKLQPTVHHEPKGSRAHLCQLCGHWEGQSPGPRAGSDGLVPPVPPKAHHWSHTMCRFQTGAPTSSWLMWL